MEGKRKRQKRQSTHKQKQRELEENAALRSYNANGRDPSLPNLPQKFRSECSHFSHPYGVLPYGNIFQALDGGSDRVRRSGLGLLWVLNDDMLVNDQQGMFKFLDGVSLARLAQTSKYMYVCSMLETHWRDLVLRYQSKNSSSCGCEIKSDGIEYWNSWRETYIRLRTTGKQQRHRYDAKPIKVNGVFSDILFRSWLCQQFHIDESLLELDNVCREQCESLSLNEFLTKYENANIPVVIEGATKDWPALKKWNKEYLISVSNGRSFRATSACAPLPAQFTMESYFRYASNASEEMPLYLFDRDFDKLAPQLMEDYRPALKKSCPYFDDESSHGHDLFSLLGTRRPDYRWLIIGPKRSGSAFHIDPNCTHAWNAPLSGRKRWIFYPPGVSPPGVLPSADGDDVIMPISIGEWYFTFWDEHVKNRSNPHVNMRPIECTVEPGSILFVPHGWWHTVLNLDDNSIALTQNYVSASNLPNVLRFLDQKIDHISGCRDRQDAVKPETLRSEFVKALKDHKPELLNKALNVKSWTCNAWSDNIEEIDHLECSNSFAKTIVEKAKLEEGVECFSFQFF